MNVWCLGSGMHVWDVGAYVIDGIHNNNKMIFWSSKVLIPRPPHPSPPQIKPSLNPSDFIRTSKKKQNKKTFFYSMLQFYINSIYSILIYFNIYCYITITLSLSLSLNLSIFFYYISRVSCVLIHRYRPSSSIRVRVRVRLDLTWYPYGFCVCVFCVVLCHVISCRGDGKKPI